VTQAPEHSGRPPIRARSGRRPIPPLIFLLVLAVGALLVWWNVLHRDEATQGSTSAACASAAKPPPNLDPHTVHLRVLNATDRAGFAQDVAAKLQQRGFVVDEVGNDSSGRTVSGVGEVRHGARGDQQAAYVAVYVPSAQDYTDTRATAVVDVVIGPQFSDIASAEQVATALSRPAKPSGC
jgi:hypothetical protein